MKLLTLNIQQYAETNGRWPERRELIVDALAGAEADVVALQAVARQAGRDDGIDQAAQIAARLPAYRHVIYHALPRGSGALGLAILARQPPLLQKTFPLSLRPGLEDDQRRLVLCTAFALGGVVLQVFNCHFSWVPEQCAENVREALGRIEGFPGPRIIVGDMNAEPGSAAMRAIAQNGFVDAWQRLHPDENGYTFEARRPRLRIDHVWCDASCASSLTSAVLVARPDPGAAVAASDHLGLLVELA
jgi:endonuclease/exonuclease/phosphatase family metal-dependent hydrolase